MAQAELRPSPDALLAELRSSKRGRLKIFLGAAPGVGKTYEMLTQGLQRRAEGVDIVIGVVETHGREETRRLTRNLPAIPPARLTYRGRALQEFDLDAMLARKPQLALIDELAHTNVPTSRHEKRWQDVEELLEAGIDVYTTMNIQHLESLNDIVARISHINVRETVPDHVIDGADQIELVDLPPEDLVKRLHEGKVYVPETAREALQHFFSPGNLTALRELVMRAVAERVDAQVLNWRRARAIEEPWRTQERLMVLIGTSPDAARLVRLGKRLAGRADSPWLVAHVSRADDASTRFDENVGAALKLAEELGAETLRLSGQDLVAEILSSANEHNVTQIVVGRSRRVCRFLAFRRSLASELVRRAGGVDIVIAAKTNAREQTPQPPAPSTRALQSYRGLRGYGEAVLATTLCALLAWLLAPLVDTANLGLVFLTGVLIAAVRGGVGPALFASVLSFLVFNYFLTEPRYTFYVSSRRDVLTLTFFLIVSLVTGQLAARVRRYVETIRANSRRMASLEDFSRRLTGIVGRSDFARVLVDYLHSTLAVDAVVVFPDLDGKLTMAAGDAGPGGLSATEETAAKWAYEHKEAAGRGTGTLPGSVWYFLPLLGRGGSLGVLGIRLHDGRHGLDPERQSLLVAMRNQAGTALEKFQLATEIERSRLLTETDKLRASLLSSVSHDLRTPLVSIKGATTALLDFADSLAPSDKRALLENVLDETDRLNRYVQNLLDMTRLGYGTLLPNRDWCDIRDIVGSARRTLRHALEHRSMKVTVADGNELIHTDAALLERVLVNLLENAAKFSPPDAAIEIKGGRDGREYRLLVCDQGPGIPAAERDKVFDLFHRVRAADQRTASTGMGLAICKGLIEALSGTIGVSSQAGKGTCIEINLPQPAEPPLEAPHE